MRVVTSNKVYYIYAHLRILQKHMKYMYTPLDCICMHKQRGRESKHAAKTLRRKQAPLILIEWIMAFHKMSYDIFSIA